jgi:uncharacterized protein (TIGR03083 family)
VDARPLFLPLHRELVSLLEGLRPEDWDRPTLAPAWAVRDVVAHLLEGDLRRLSAQRDGQVPSSPKPITSEADLVAFLNDLNAEWVRVARRFSPRVLVDLLKVTGPAVAALFSSLDPEAAALFPVSWAGEAASKSWFDVGRDYTERWHHQQQLRLAVKAPSLTDPLWLRPVLELSVRALPHRYRGTVAADGERVEIVVRGASGGSWTLAHEEGAWQLYAGAASGAAARIDLNEDAAWRVFFKALPAGVAPPITIEGRPELGRAFLTAWAVMA